VSEREVEGTGRRGRRCKQLKEKRRYWKLKEGYKIILSRELALEKTLECRMTDNVMNE
jgi:hypothetical protein